MDVEWDENNEATANQHLFFLFPVGSALRVREQYDEYVDDVAEYVGDLYSGERGSLDPTELDHGLRWRPSLFGTPEDRREWFRGFTVGGSFASQTRFRHAVGALVDRNWHDLRHRFRHLTAADVDHVRSREESVYFEGFYFDFFEDIMSRTFLYLRKEFGININRDNLENRDVYKEVRARRFGRRAFTRMKALADSRRRGRVARRYGAFPLSSRLRLLDEPTTALIGSYLHSDLNYAMQDPEYQTSRRGHQRIDRRLYDARSNFRRQRRDYPEFTEPYAP